jgi:hypothetical protein
MITHQNTSVDQRAKDFLGQTCPKHPLSDYEYICTHSKCISEAPKCFFCSKCWAHHQSIHEKQSYLDFKKVFSMKKVKKLFDIQKHEAKIKSAKKSYNDNVDSFCSSLLESVTKLIEEFKLKAKATHSFSYDYSALEILEKDFDFEFTKLFSCNDPIPNKVLQDYLRFYVKFEENVTQERKAPEIKLMDLTNKVRES